MADFQPTDAQLGITKTSDSDLLEVSRFCQQSNKREG